MGKKRGEAEKVYVLYTRFNVDNYGRPLKEIADHLRLVFTT